MNKRLTDEDNALLAELGFDFTPQKVKSNASGDESALDIFREVRKFYDEHGRMPDQNPKRNFLEHILASRMEVLNQSEKSDALTQALDDQEIQVDNSHIITDQTN